MENSNKTAFIVGRFQVANLANTGYDKMIESVLSRGFKSVNIVVGLAAVPCTKNNPFDFETRKLMLQQAYGDKVSIYYIQDCALDELWSQKLDNLIKTVSSDDIVIIGSNDGFLNHYNGIYTDKFELYNQTEFVSGIETIKQSTKCYKQSEDWRRGVIYATQTRYPTMYSTIDAAIFNDVDLKQIYLARKPNEKLIRFVGGFVDPSDQSLEMTVAREVQEETGLSVNSGHIIYVCSQLVDDWRYRNEIDKIMTHLFAVVRSDGRAKASDDIASIYLKNFDELKEEDFVPEHRSLFNKLYNWRLNYLKMK